MLSCTPRKIRIAVGSTVGALFLISMVLWFGIQDIKSGEKKLVRSRLSEYGPCNNTDTSFVFPYNIPLASNPPNGEPNVVQVDISVTSVNPETQSYKLHFQFTPFGDLADRPNGLEPLSTIPSASDNLKLLKFDVNITISTTTFRFKALESMQPADVSLVINGDINDYPFDKYTSIFLMTGTVRNSTSNAFTPLSLVASANAPISAYTAKFPFVCDASAPRDATLVFAQAVIKRAGTTKVFVVILTAFMWLLSLLMITLAVSVWLRGRKVEPPTLAVAVSMMFALPSIRNSQPLAPPIGVTVDVVGFFWNMVLVAIAASLLLTNYIVRNTGKKGEGDNLFKDKDRVVPVAWQK